MTDYNPNGDPRIVRAPDSPRYNGDPRPPAAVFHVRPIDPPAPPVRLLVGANPPSISRQVKWDEIDRPRQTGAVEYMGHSLRELRISAAASLLPESRSLESKMLDLELKLMFPKPPRGEPPVCRIEGIGMTPVIKGHPWVLLQMDFTNEERNDDGTRGLVMFDMIFLEYVSPATISGPAQSQAIAAALRGPSTAPGFSMADGFTPPFGSGQSAPVAPSSRSYTVRSGDTLGSIAVSQLGNYNRWQEIATLNGIRDPRTLRVGTVLRLP